MKKIIEIMVVFFTLSAFTFAGTPLKVALFSPLEIPQGESVTGLSLNVIYGETASTAGIELGFFVNNSNNLVGLQGSGLANISANMELGAQFGTVNIVRGTGIQVGMINYSEQFRGIQLGMINYAQSLQGLQLGLANINFSGPIPVFPFINFSFSF